MTFKSPVTMRIPAVPASAPPPSWPDAPPEAHSTEPAISLPRSSVRDRANLTLLTGPSAGEVFPLVRLETVIGREPSVDLAFDDAAISRRHARVLREAARTSQASLASQHPNPQEIEFVLEDLGSTNGTYVSAEPVTRRVLRTGDQIQIGPNLLFRFAMTDEAEERLQRQLFESSIRDPLTHAYNRKYLNERLAAEVAHARRHATKLALLMLDLDDFKGTNDRHGHLAGDAVLRQVAATVVGLIRLEDVFARFGGEEFVVLTRGDGVQNASQLGERLRRAIEDARVDFEGKAIGVTVSIGVAELDEVTAGPAPQAAESHALIDRADARLYRAKALGRNRVTAADS